AEQRVDFLLVGRGAEGDRRQCLGLASCEQCRAVSARQNLHLSAQGADFSRATVVDAAVLLEDYASDTLTQNLFGGFIQFVSTVGETWSKLRDDAVRECVNGRIAFLFAGELQHVFQLCRHPLPRRGEQLGIMLLQSKITLGFTCEAAQFSV